VRLLVVGGAGLVGRHLVAAAAAAGHQVLAPPRAELDLGAAASLGPALRAIAPDVVINAAAVADVDRAEREPTLAHAVNAAGADALARACAERGAPCLYLSTDYVFAGEVDRQYPVDATPAPLQAYGRSKLAGEALVRAAGGTVVRTSWVFGAAASPARAGLVGRVVAAALADAAGAPTPALVMTDQRRSRPTWADDLAAALLVLAERPPGQRPPVVHVAGDEPTSPHGWARAIAAEVAGQLGRPPLPIATGPAIDPPGAAPRPRWSVLALDDDRLGLAARPWRRGLAPTVAALLAHGGRR
jgi:dTDP-4-dehydrorhamnose reductase